MHWKALPLSTRMSRAFSKGKEETGSAVVEFAFCCLLLMPLLLGLIAIGFALIRELQVVQVCRDAGHMYAKGVDFSTNPNNRNMLTNLAKELNLTDNSQSPGVIILTTVLHGGDVDCQAEGLASPCDLITNQIKIGDQTILSSYGTPKNANYLAGPGNQAQNIPTSLENNWSQTTTGTPSQGASGQVAYVAEVIVRISDLNWTGYIGTRIRATSIF